MLFWVLALGRAKERHIDLDCDYEAVKEILRIVHHVDRNFTTNGQKQYEPKMLQELYLVADRMDFPVIRKLCEEQMLDRPSIEMANAAHSLGLHDMLINILTKMTAKDVQIFISEGNKPNLSPHLIFTKEDVLFFYQKTRGPLVAGPVAETKPPLNLEEISKDLEEPRIDLGQKWSMSDVSLQTKNSLGRVLHSNKAALACVSEHFKKVFFENSATEFKLFEDVRLNLELLNRRL